LQQRGLKAAAIQLDVADPQQAGDAVAFTVATFGRIDVLHNNAAILSREVAADQATDIGQLDSV